MLEVMTTFQVILVRMADWNTIAGRVERPKKHYLLSHPWDFSD
jgi:hypothetical protein